MNASSQSNTDLRQRQTGKENQESAPDAQDSCKSSVTEEHVQVRLMISLHVSSSLAESVYDTKFFISLLGRAFKVMKDSIYFIVIAFLVAELFKILIYAN